MSSTNIEIEDPYVLSLADRILNTMKLATVKAIAHNANPQAVKISGNPNSFEQISLSYVKTRSKNKQEEAGKKAMNLLSLPLSEREKEFGELARIDLRSDMEISEQVHALGIPANLKWPSGHEGSLEIVNNRLKSGSSNLRGRTTHRLITEDFIGKNKPGDLTKVYSLDTKASSGSVSWKVSYENMITITRNEKLILDTKFGRKRLNFIGAKYEELGGEKSSLGKPVSEVVALDGEVFAMKRDYEHGSIYWSFSTGAHEIRSQIRDKWISLGGEKSFLGFPISDSLTSGIFNSDILADKPGLYNHFEHGAIYWSEKTGAHEVHGSILQKWEEKGAEKNLGLGYPVTDEMDTSDKKGRYSRFENGSIFYTGNTGACIIGGSVRDKWVSLGGEKSFLGYPISDPITLTGHSFGGFLNPGSVNHFEHGSIYSRLSGEACVIFGAIRDKWISLGGEGGFLGFPTTDECTTPDNIGRYNHFQGGSIYWTPYTGAQEVHGDIRDKWKNLGWEQSYLGYPVTDENSTPDNIGRYNHFQGGSIYWTPDIGAKVVHKKVRDKWESLGWEQGKLGYPLSDSIIYSSNTIYNKFQGGFIRVQGSETEVGTPYSGIDFKIESLHCDVETPPAWWGSDEIIISGVGTDEYLNSTSAGTISKDCDSGGHYKIDRVLVGHQLNNPGWPKVFLATMLLAEDEGSTGLGELSGIQKKIIDGIKSELINYLTKLGISGVGALVGESLGGALGGPIGFIVGAIVGYLVGKFFEWIIGFFNDQWFNPVVDSLILPSVYTLWEGKPATALKVFGFDRVDGGEGRYHINAGWELVNQ